MSDSVSNKQKTKEVLHIYINVCYFNIFFVCVYCFLLAEAVLFCICMYVCMYDCSIFFCSNQERKMMYMMREVRLLQTELK